MAKKLDYWDVEELAATILGIENEDYADSDTLDDSLYEKCGVTFEQFETVVNLLIDYTPIIATALTEVKFHAFVKDGFCIVKKECGNG